MANSAIMMKRQNEGRLIKTITVSEQTSAITIDKDDDGNPFRLKSFMFLALSDTVFNASAFYYKFIINFDGGSSQYCPSLFSGANSKVIQVNIDILNGYINTLSGGWLAGNANANNPYIGGPMTAWYPNPETMNPITKIVTNGITFPAGAKVYLFGLEA